MALMIVVIGGSVLTNRNEPMPRLNLRKVDLIASEIKKAIKKKNFSLILVHGMGAFGHPTAKKFGINVPSYNPQKIKGMQKLVLHLNKLNSTFVDRLMKNGLNVISFESNPAITDKGKIVKMSIDTLKKFLSKGFIPVLQAYPAYDLSYGIAILSSDHLGPYLAQKLDADILIGGTSVDGVYTKNPSEQGAKLVKKITPHQRKSITGFFSSAGYTDVTGGMKRKVSEYLKAAQHGVLSRIINIAKPGVLSQTILGKNHGTLIAKK